ncbi:MAG: single-stranded-DNA-specific exonuclease RecJ [Acidobacteriaceae bacterium]|nr:single-stranded-DNA-specific exonuclease RecJ [Acidobacteriaceae bacterium]
MVLPEAARSWVRPAARWIEPSMDPLSADVLSKELGIHRLAAAVLVQRGYCDPQAAGNFLSPKLDSLHDPLLMRDMSTAASRLQAAMQARERVLLYGDYDVDGTSSIVILKKAIEILGGHADFHIPHRLKDGYGMRSEVIRQAAETGVRLIVSVDTGIRANEVVRYANDLKIDVIVTDHHLPEVELPSAVAVLNPNRPDCSYPNKDLCGAGVTFKLVHALLAASGMAVSRQNSLLDSFLKPVAIATVADVVPLTGENRAIVQRGLSGLRQVRNPGMRALLSVAGFDDGECPSAHQVAFRLAPRINAAGRMATAYDVIELFLTEDFDRARSLAEQLDGLNQERQQTEAEIVDEILQQCESGFSPDEFAALVFTGDNWHLGVLGIVASRLVEQLSRPVFVLSDAEPVDGQRHLAGSGRSIAGFHLLEALESMPDLFRKFGGHRQAAGLTLPAHHAEEFRRRFNEYAIGRLTSDDLRPQHAVDAAASFSELNDRCVEHVRALGPFGCGNPTPTFLSKAAEVAGPAKALKEGKHFRVPIRHDGRLLFCNAWNYGAREELFQRGRKLDLLFQIEDDPVARKRGYGSWALSIKDVRPIE